MLLGIDHVVIAVPDPDATAAEISDLCGLRASGGGRHERLGTFNRLVWLGDSYLEFIGVFDAGVARATWLGPAVLGALGRGGGLATWAVATDDLHGALDHLRTAGIEAEPLPGERIRTDGRVVRWRLATLAPLGPGQPPFVIEHDTRAAEWTPSEREQRAAEVHPIGGRVDLRELRLRARDPAALGRVLNAVLGLEINERAGRVEATIGSQRIAVVRDGPPTLRLAVDRPVEARTIEMSGCRFEIRGSEPANRATPV